MLAIAAAETDLQDAVAAVVERWLGAADPAVLIDADRVHRGRAKVGGQRGAVLAVVKRDTAQVCKGAAAILGGVFHAMLQAGLGDIFSLLRLDFAVGAVDRHAAVAADQQCYGCQQRDCHHHGQ